MLCSVSLGSLKLCVKVPTLSDCLRQSWRATEFRGSFVARSGHVGFI
ncbi:MAG: hypothetical protein HXK63_01450 [Campylobacter sp.]|nr:hypothetical protein [Campylobacter sp.]